MERAWDPSINSQIGETLYRSREFLDSLAEGIMLIDLNGIIVDCNETAASLLGTPVSQMIGRQISDPLWGSVNEFGNVIHRSQLPAMITISTGEPVVDTIIGIDMPGDGRRWMEGHFGYVDNHPRSLLCIIS
jgi:PAS domain-containing protein